MPLAPRSSAERELWSLVVEADGAGHDPTPLRDHARDLWLAAAGINVLRFENCETLDRTAAVEPFISSASRY